MGGGDWREAALGRFGSHPRGPRTIFLGACMATNLFKQAPPRTAQRVVCLLVREINCSNRALDQTSRWVIPGSRLFNLMVWPSSHRKEIFEVLWHVLSGSPPSVRKKNRAPVMARGPAFPNQRENRS